MSILQRTEIQVESPISDKIDKSVPFPSITAQTNNSNNGTYYDALN